MCSRRWESGGTRQRKRLPTTTFVYKPLRYKCVLTTNVFSVLTTNVFSVLTTNVFSVLTTNVFSVLTTNVFSVLTTNVFSVLTLTYDYVCLQAPTVY
jgi:hypothetical protein